MNFFEWFKDWRKRQKKQRDIRRDRERRARASKSRRALDENAIPPRRWYHHFARLFEFEFLDKYKRWQKEQKARNEMIRKRELRARQREQELRRQKIDKTEDFIPEEAIPEKTAVVKNTGPQPWALVIIFFTALFLVSGAITWFMVANQKPLVVRNSEEESPVVPPVAMTLSGRPGEALRTPSPDLGEVNELQDQADEAFREGNYEMAEQLLRKILPQARLKALTGFQIYICLLKQGKTGEARLLASRFPHVSIAKNPSPFYVQAVDALLVGNTELALSSMELARKQFPETAALYDKVLRDANLIP